MNHFFNSGVYRWFSPYTGKSYVGSSSDIWKRKNEHLRKLNLNEHENPKFQNAWNKYGDFEFEMLAFCGEQDLLWQEQIAIDAFDAVRCGYNISPIAGAPMRGRKATEETRRKMSLAHKGKAKSVEHVAKIAAAHRGTKRSAAIKAKFSVMRKGKPATEQQLYNLSIEWNRPKSPKQPRLRVPIETMKQNMRAAWTPERRAAQAARIAQLNRDRVTVAN